MNLKLRAMKESIVKHLKALSGVLLILAIQGCVFASTRLVSDNRASGEFEMRGNAVARYEFIQRAANDHCGHDARYLGMRTMSIGSATTGGAEMDVERPVFAFRCD